MNMILELLGLGVLGAIGKTVYDETKKEQPSNNGNQSTASNNTKSEWKQSFVDLYEDIPSLNAKPYLTSNFYISSYICPTCKNNMYKTVFRIGGEPIIKTPTIPITMKRLFTCPNCKTFYTPLPGQKLSHGMVYRKKCSSDYDTLLREYDYIGTTQGRPDA